MRCVTARRSGSGACPERSGLAFAGVRGAAADLIGRIRGSSLMISIENVGSLIGRRRRDALLSGELRVVWTTDAPYRQTAEPVDRFARRGVLAVEMQAVCRGIHRFLKDRLPRPVTWIWPGGT